jgi:hypothetical protein
MLAPCSGLHSHSLCLPTDHPRKEPLFIHSSNFHLLGTVNLPGAENPPKEPHLTLPPHSKNAQIQMTPVSQMGKMIPDVPPGPDACSSSFTQEIVFGEVWQVGKPLSGF